MLMVERVLNDRSDGSAEILSIVFLIVFIALISSGAVIARKSHSTQDPTNYLKPPAIIPQPVKLEVKDGSFHIDSLTRIVGSPADKQTRAVAESLAGRLRTATGFPLRVIAGKRKPGSNVISLIRMPVKGLPPEGYRLSVTARGVRITGGDGAGLFYGVQTFLQLLPPEVFGKEVRQDVSWTIPAVAIVDWPRFPWRGLHLDVSRHFFRKEFVKRYIDYLSMYKMNTFHWHLTDDQGWRIEIKKYPRLTGFGAWRNGSMVGPYSDMKFDTIRYGGYYTQDDIKEIVAYAKTRYVSVVPEIEMPGHSLAALAAYPQLSCTGGPFDVGKAWGVYDDVYCPKESTFIFLKNVLKEVCALFPGKYIHIGGDECPKVRWKTCAHCQALIRKKRLKNENGLQSYFIKRIEKFLNAKGKQIIGWDEILEGGLAPNAAVMSWRGTSGGIAAARKRHLVVMSPASHCYFDHYQGKPKYEPLAIGGYTPVEMVYSYEPVPERLSASKRRYILGAQGNMWTEYVASPQHIEYMTMPRMAALAEVVWSPKRARNYNDFQGRLLRHFQVLDNLGVNYSKAIYEIKAAVKKSPSADGILLELSTPFDSAGIHYTLDGSDPKISSPVYGGAINLTKSCAFKAAYFKDGIQRGRTLEQEFSISKSTSKPIYLRTPPDEKYFNDGPFTLVNGIRGDLQRYGADWLGFQGPDLEAIIDLQKQDRISKVTLDVFDGEGSWIHPPKSVEVFVSTDSITFTSVKKLDARDISRAGNSIEMKIGSQRARYVKVVAANLGKIPEGKPGAGQDAWLFVDEIIVE